MFSSSILWIGDMRKTPCVKIKPVQSRIFHLLQLDKVEVRTSLEFLDDLIYLHKAVYMLNVCV
jgi:hypothetical protein